PTRRLPPPATPLPYTTLFRSCGDRDGGERLHLDAGPGDDADRGFDAEEVVRVPGEVHRHARERQWVTEGDQVARPLGRHDAGQTDRKSTRLNSSHQIISYAVF